MLKVNKSAPIRLANAQLQLRKGTAASIVLKPIAYGRQRFNAIASTNPVSSTEQGSYKRSARNWDLIYGFLSMHF